MDGAAATPPPAPRTQRLALVLPSTGEFDSRTYRIASAAVARGHTVTVIARARPGLPSEERHPAGYTILRVPFAAIDGLPFPRLVRAARVAVRRLYAWRTGTAYRPPPPAGTILSASPGAYPATRPATHAGASPGPRTASLPRRLASAAMTNLAIPLQIRAQGRFALRVAPTADLYHGMAYMGIPVALRLARRDRARVVYDARDIYLDAANLARMRGPIRGFLRRAERRWARRADRVITVNRPYAEVMAGRWDVPLPLIVLNCSYRFSPPEPPPRLVHEALGLDPATRVVLYQGGFSRDRGIEQLCAAIDAVPRAVLVLLGYGQLEAEIRARAAASAGLVHVLPAVPPTELLRWVASADVVAIPIQPTTLNHRLTTPNKLFEAMAAGVPVVASDLAGMAPIVTETGCGVVCDPTEPAAIAAAIRAILDAPADERAAYRARALAAAHATYNWESQVARLFEAYGRLTGRPW
jgi:glycosyltransferase involved in cell wall biosynthesis